MRVQLNKDEEKREAVRINHDKLQYFRFIEMSRHGKPIAVGSIIITQEPVSADYNTTEEDDNGHLKLGACMKEEEYRAII